MVAFWDFKILYLYYLSWSKVLLVNLIIPTESTPKCKLFTIFWVFYLNRASFNPRTLRQVRSWLSWDIITRILPCVTWLTEMGVSPTKPLSYITTEFTLEFYVICSMLRTIFFTSSYKLSCTFSTHKLFRLKYLIRLFLLNSTIFHTTKISLFAFKAFIVA